MWFFFIKNLVKGLLSFDFWISRLFVTIFRNITTFQDAISPKAMELFQKKFSQLFPSRQALSKFFICFAITWNLNFAVNLLTLFSRQKPLKSENKKHRIFWNTEFYHSAKIDLKRIKNAKVVSRLQLFASNGPQRVNVTHLHNNHPNLTDRF